MELPMFPLGTVLLPGETLPLHVFEPRYRQMVAHCLEREEPRFGVVLIARGREVGGGDTRHGMGTVAHILRVSSTPQGTISLLVAGGRRLRVNRWLDDDPYPRADVEELDDDTILTAIDAGDEMAVLVERIRAQAIQLGDLPADAPVGMLPLGQHDRYRLLCADGAQARARLFGELLEELDQIQRFRLGLPNM